MENEKRKFSNIHNLGLLFGDFIVIFLAVLMAAGLLFFLTAYGKGEGAPYAEIRVGERLVQTVELHAGQMKQFSANGSLGKCIIEANDGKIRVKSASCSDQVCLNTGWINKPGQAIVCLPNKLVVSIKSEDAHPEVDAITGVPAGTN